MGIKFANNASSNITHALTADATSVSITPGTGDLFPSIVEGTDYFYATLAGNNGLEIVKVTNRTLDNMTIERAQDGTDALLFSTGDLFELRIVAADFEDTFAKVDSMLEESLEENTSMVNAALANKAPTSHSSASTTYGVGTGGMYGHVKLSDYASNLYGVPEGIAATPLAVDKAIDSAVDAAVRESASASSAMVSSLDTTLRTFIAEEVAKCLKTSGGTISGGIAGSGNMITGKNNSGYVQLCGGTSYGQGASISLDGKESSAPGLIKLHASDGTTATDLTVSPSSVKVNGNDVLTSAGGYLNNNLYSTNGYPLRSAVENGRIEISGSLSTGGGRLLLYGKDHADYPGESRLVSGDTNFRVLANGTAYLGGRVIDAIYSSGSNYIRYTNGLQLCWGNCADSSWATFPAAFKSKPNVVVTHAMASTSGGTHATGVYIESATRFYYKSGYSSSTCWWIAIGFWK